MFLRFQPAVMLATSSSSQDITVCRNNAVDMIVKILIIRLNVQKNKLLL